MKRYFLRLIILAVTFFIGIGACVLYYFNSSSKAITPALAVSLEIAKPELSKDIKCAESKSFPGLSQKISEIKRGKSGYFPNDSFAGGWTERDVFINDWYGKHLKAMNEKSLFDNEYADSETYRFLWLRTFHHPIFVRIERRQNEVRMFTKELNGAGGYEPGKILRTNTRKLTESEWCEFLMLLEKADYWKLATNKDDMGNDGAEWILEGVKDSRYQVVDRWSPRDGAYREACVYLLKISGVDVDKIKDDLY